MLPGFWRGLALAWLALLLADAPVWLTQYGMQLAAADEPAGRLRGLRWLRAWGNQEVLLRECYGRTRMAENMDLVGWLIAGGRSMEPNAARDIYYRVTGRAFNSVPAPNVRTGRGRWGQLDDWTWDVDQGGEQVGGRIKGLSLSSSRLDGVVQPDEATVYLEWVLEFRNDSASQHEARAQLLLPAGGVVTRLTLWVHGEEREAAFAGRGKVREAYQKVAIRLHRDPVLVTTCGPDRVLMQCYPVPPGGGTMRVRLGITAPLTLLSAEEGALRWPSFLERNFTLMPSVRHAVWVESPAVLTTGGKTFKAEQPKPGRFVVRGQASEADLQSPSNTVRVRRAGNIAAVWAADTFDQPNQAVRQTIVETAAARPARVVVVLDGSRPMAEYLGEVVAALQRMPEGIELAVLVANDGASVLGGPGFKSDVQGRSALLHELAQWKPLGGQDNVPALERAWELAAEKPGSLILWIHGPQPTLLASVDSLRQSWERQPNGPALWEIQTCAGPNRLIEKLDGIGTVHAIARVSGLGSDLERIAEGWRAGARAYAFVRERGGPAGSAANASGPRASLHVVRLWAFDEVGKLRAARRLEAGIQLSGRYQLVTPVSGAVVLETEQQYRANGLEPADPAIVPAIPEPPSWALLIVGLILMGAAVRTFRFARRTAPSKLGA